MDCKYKIRSFAVGWACALFIAFSMCTSLVAQETSPGSPPLPRETSLNSASESDNHVAAMNFINVELERSAMLFERTREALDSWSPLPAIPGESEQKRSDRVSQNEELLDRLSKQLQDIQHAREGLMNAMVRETITDAARRAKVAQ